MTAQEQKQQKQADNSVPNAAAALVCQVAKGGTA